MSGPDPADIDWQRQSARAVIQRSAADCVALFSAFERTPEWLVELRSARPRTYDDAGRAEVVDYMAAPVRGGYTYPVRYAYDDDGLGLTWHGEVPGGARGVEGTVRFEPAGDDRCEMRYETAVRLSAEMPDWFRAAQRDRPVDHLCRAFKRWAEGGA